jgi:hypothetical protein
VLVGALVASKFDPSEVGTLVEFESESPDVGRLVVVGLNVFVGDVVV